MKKRAPFGLVAGLFLVCVFAVCLFMTVGAGAGVYKDITQVMEEQYASRTALGYVTQKLRQSDAAGSVELGSLGGVDAVIIREDIDGEEYTTFVYCYEGYITELFCPASEALTPSDGLTVIAAESLDFTLTGKLLRVDCSTELGDGTAYVYLRSGGERA